MRKVKSKNKMIIVLTAVFGVAIFLGLNLQLAATVHAADIVVYKSATCKCCSKWVTHLENSGFSVKAVDRQDMPKVKKNFGVKQQYQSCHTAKVGKYFIEGHVPASDIKMLIKEKPDAIGLAVPGMPMGSPGMEGHRKDRYSVLLIDKNDQYKVYSEH